jgi:antitoxin ParD1/3/4
MADKNTSIVLSDHWQRFIKQQVANGRFTSASEVIREGLRLAEERQRRIDRLNALIDEGEASGAPIDFDFDAFIAEMHDEVDEAKTRKAA